MWVKKNEARKNICGDKVRYVRLGKYSKNHVKITQNQLAARLQSRGLMLERVTISRIEHGIRPVSDIELACLADALKVPTDYLLKDAKHILPELGYEFLTVAEESND